MVLACFSPSISLALSRHLFIWKACTLKEFSEDETPHSALSPWRCQAPHRAASPAHPPSWSPPCFQLWKIWKYHPNHFQSSLASFFFRGSQNCGLLSKRWFWTSSLLWLPSQKGRLLVCLQLQNHTCKAVKRMWILYYFKSYHLFCLWRYILHWASLNKFPEVEILWQRNLELTSVSPHLMVFWIPHRFHHTEAELFLRGHNRTKHNAHTSPLSTCVVLNRTWTANTMIKLPIRLIKFENARGTDIISVLSGRGAFIPATSLTGFENLSVEVWRQ